MSFRAQQQQSSPSNEGWKAEGFLNIEVVQIIDGEEVVQKVGAIPLRKSNDSEMELARWLASDDSNAEKLRASVRFVYRSAEPKKRSLVPIIK